MKGIEIVNALKDELSARSAAIAACFAPPKLAVVRVGEKPDDVAYERNAVKRCKSVGIQCERHIFDADVTNEAFLQVFRRINGDGSVHGVLVFSPLPDRIDAAAVKAAIDPAKDVDCMSPVNLAKLFAGDASGHAPCTPLAVLEMLRFYGIPIKGRRVTLVGRSLVVGKPLAMLLLAEHATLTVCHTRTLDLGAECRRADILIAAAGKAGMISAGDIKPGAAVIDVGINVDEEGALCGDVDYAAACGVAGCITPVPGGVGSVTASMLARNTLNACDMLRAR